MPQRTPAQRIVEVFNRAVSVFGGQDLATKWLHTENGVLEHKKPVTVARDSDEGERRVLDVLGRIEHGIFS